MSSELATTLTTLGSLLVIGGSASLFLLRNMFRSELASFREDLRKEFVTQSVMKVRNESTERRFGAVERRVDVLEAK